VAAHHAPVTQSPAAPTLTPGLTLSGDKPASVPARAAWTFFEFGGGPYFVVLQIFVFAPYFANHVMIGDPVTGQAYWGYAGGVAGLLIAIMSPLIGAIADQYGPRKPGVVVFTMLALPFMGLLWFAVPGEVALALACIVGASLFFELAFIFHNAMLPAIAPANRLGILSASGYAMSYAGAILAFAVWLALPGFGLTGGPEDQFAQARASGPMAMLAAIIFVVPLLILTPDTPSSGRSLASCASSGARSLWATIRKMGAYRNIATFLVARMIYYDGLVAVFAFVGIYAATAFGWSEQGGIYGLLIIITAAMSAVIGGLIDDRIGSRRTILVSLAAFSIALASNLGTNTTQIAYLIPVTAEMSAWQVPLLGAGLAAIGFPTFPEQVFVIVGVAGGLFIGPALSSSRTLMARLAPPGQVAEFFGLYNLTGRATAFLAPMTIGLITQITNDQRAGLGVIFIFIGIGFTLLLFVREPARDA
jgi:UMF1 family MFS transporter